VDRIARECQLSREVVARLLCKVDTRKNAPFAGPLLLSVGTRLNQLSARKRVTRSRSDNNECEESGVGTRGGVGGGVGGARKGWSLDVNTLKRQRKRRSTFDTTADADERVAGKGPKRNRTHGLFLFFTFFFCLAHVFPPFFYAEIAADASWNRTSICKYMHIYVHIRSHTYKCVYTHSLYWYMCKFICIYLHIFMHVHAHTTIMYSNVRAIHTHANTLSHTHTHVCIHIYVYAHTYSLTHSTCTHTNAFEFIYVVNIHVCVYIHVYFLIYIIHMHIYVYMCIN